MVNVSAISSLYRDAFGSHDQVLFLEKQRKTMEHNIEGFIRQNQSIHEVAHTALQ